MLIRINDNSWMHLEQVPVEFEPVIYDHFSATHPRRRYIDTEQYGWDGLIRRYDISHNRLALPFYNELVALCNKHDVPVDYADQREHISKPSLDIDPNLFDNITLESYQIRAIQACISNDIGIISSPTGSGKGEIIAATVKSYNLPAVIIADQRIVIEQLCNRLKLREVADGNIGLFYGGSTPSGQSIVVGSIQSLCNPPISLKLSRPDMYKKRMARAKLFQGIVAQSQLLMVDECDKCSSEQYKKLFKHYFKGRYRFGLSGTPFDKKKPVESLIVREHLGSIICHIERSEVEATGRIIRLKFIMSTVGSYNRADDRTAFDIAEKEQIIYNETFHEKIKSIISQFPNDNFMIIIDTSALEELGKFLEHKIPDSEFIYGKTSTKKRQEAVSKFEKRKLRCLISGKILKRGLDIKGGIDNLIYIGGGKLWSNIDQICGRAVRVNERRFARVFGFMFLGNKYLYEHGREQLRAVIDMGYSTKIILNNQVYGGKDFLKVYRRG